MKETKRPMYIMMALTLSAGLVWMLFASMLRSAAFFSQHDKLEQLPQPVLRPVDLDAPVPTSLPQEVSIVVDDFMPQPHQGETVYFYNRLDGDRGQLGDVNIDWGEGRVTATLKSGTWGGLWTSLEHPNREANPIDFTAILPSQIQADYQSAITGIQIQLADSGANRRLVVELKDERDNSVRWSSGVTLTGGIQQLDFPLNGITETTSLLWFLQDANVGDHVVVDRISLTATNSISDISEAAFTWSYGMLLNNWDANTGLVRDQGRAASGEFDAVQSTGALAAATAMANQLDIVDDEDAIQIVTTISDTLLTELPRYHGLWPHWVEITPSSTFTIEPGTEWSSIDTAITAIGLLEAQTSLGLVTSGTEAFLTQIDWNDLLGPNGISHGYSYAGDLLPYAWDTFGGESWLMQLTYASATGQVAPMALPQPPTANGSGFIDELAWLFAPAPATDYWGIDWQAYRVEAASAQLDYYPDNYPGHCFDRLGLLGLSAAEVPVPSAVSPAQIYQAFGVGGRFAPANDGSTLMGGPVVIPHYAGLVASLAADPARMMWGWMLTQKFLSPLNNVESLMFTKEATNCQDAGEVYWNHFKGSWNLSLQALGWGRYLAERRGQMPVLWRALTTNSFFLSGYQVLAPLPLFAVRIDGPQETESGISTVFTATYEPLNASQPITLTWNSGAVGATATYQWKFSGNQTVVVTATNHGGSVVTASHKVLVRPRSKVFLPLIVQQ